MSRTWGLVRDSASLNRNRGKAYMSHSHDHSSNISLKQNTYEHNEHRENNACVKGEVH